MNTIFSWKLPRWLVICRFFFLVSSAAATSRTWTGNGGSSYWSASANWSPAGSPNDGDQLIFPGGASRLINTNDLPNLRLNSITLNGSAGGFSLSGNPLSLDSNITDVHSGGANTVNMDIQFTSSGSIDAGSTGTLILNSGITANTELDIVSLLYTNLIVSGAIQGQCALVKIGDGSARLNGPLPNTYTGGTDVRGGQLHLSKSGATRTAISSPVRIGDNTFIYSELDEDFSGQLPLNSDVMVSSNGYWNVNFDSTVTNLVMISGDIGGAGTLHLRGDCQFITGPSYEVWHTDYSLFHCNVDLGTQSRRFTLNNVDGVFGAASIEFDGVISGSTGGGMSVFGIGEIYMRNTNTFSGPLYLDRATLSAEYPDSLGNTNYSIILTNNADLGLYGFSAFTLYKPIVSYGAYMSFNHDTTLAGPLTLNGELLLGTYDQGGFHNISLPSQISGSGFLELSYGNYQISGAQANSFNGAVIVGELDTNIDTLTLAKTSNARAFQGALVVEGNSIVTWAGDEQIPNSDVTVSSTSSLNLANHSESLASIYFDGGGAVSNVNYLSVAGPVTVNTNYFNDNSLAVISGNLSYAGNMTFNVSNTVTRPAIQLSGTISGVGGIVKNGVGSMRIASTGSYSGPVIVNQGTLIVSNSTALGSTSSATTVTDGGTLEMDGISSFLKTLHLAGNGAYGTNGALSCKTASTIGSSIVLDAPATIRNDDMFAPFVLNSTISGNGPLSKNGAGLVELAGSFGNTYTGDMLANEGTLWLAKPNGIAAVPGNLIVGTRVGNFGAGTIATVVCYQDDAIVGTNITVNGGSLYNLNNYNESLGSVILNNGGSIQTGIGLLGFIGSGTTPRVAVNPGTSGASTISGRLMILFGGTFNVASRQSILVTAPELDITAGIADSITGNFLKTGPGRMRLSNSNSFNATLTVDQGTLMVSNKSALGTATGGTTITGTGKLSLDGGINVANEPLTLVSSNAAALESVSGSNTWTAPIVLSGDSGINVASGYLQVLNTVSGPGSLIKLGAGTLQFWGFVPNTYTGPTIVSAGVLEAGRTSQLSVSTNIVVGDNSTSGTLATLRLLRDQQIAPTANVVVNSSGKLDLYNFPTVPAPNQTLRTLEGSGIVSLSRADSKLTISNEVSFDFNGTAIGAGVFTKIGAATMGNSGVWNLSSTGEISDGVFSVNGTVYNKLHVHNSARVQGDGQVMNRVAVDAGGVISANSKFPEHQGGNLQITDLEMQPGGVISLKILGPTPTAGNDSLTVQTANITNATLSTGFGYPPRAGDVVVQLSKLGASPLAGTFSGFAEGVPKALGDYTVVPSYVGGSGHDFTLTVTNLAGGFAGYRLAEGNGNQTVEPDECNLLYVGLENQRGTPLVVTSAVLRATTADALVTVASATYPTIAPNDAVNNLTPFQFRTTTNLPCGMNVGFELVIGAQNEGMFAIDFIVGSGSDCSHPTGPCESCNVVTGQFTTNTPATLFPINFIGSYSLCYPPKAFPGIDADTNLPPVPYLTHTFTNSTTNTVCVTFQLDPGCPGTPTNAFGVAAYLGTFVADHPEFGYLGDNGDGYPNFSVQVPAGSNVVAVVMANSTNLVCDHYTLEAFGLPCAAPVLAIASETAPSTVRVNWSTAYPGWVAQQAAALNSSFSDVTQSATIVSGRYSLTNLPVTTNQFFRLKNN